MLKSIARLEAIVGSKVGHFLIDQDVSIPAAKEMCNQFLTYLQSLEDNAKAQAAQAAQAVPASPAPVESPKEA